MTEVSAKNGGRVGEIGFVLPSFAKLLVFVCVVLAADFAIGLLNPLGQWYSALSKPPFNPPSYIFAPVWSVIYVLIAIAGWRVWEHKDDWIGKALWVGQMALNFTWSPVFFTHSTKGALIIIFATLLTILAFIAQQWSRDRWSALLFAPYALWVVRSRFERQHSGAQRLIRGLPPECPRGPEWIEVRRSPPKIPVHRGKRTPFVLNRFFWIEAAPFAGAG